MEAIVLAGGFGTRLKEIVKEIPKPMANINGKPFLEILLTFLKKRGIKKVVLSVGYKQQYIINYFKNDFLGLEVIYSKEDEPLKTGGAIKKALKLTKNENIFILNGDTFFNVALQDMLKKHIAREGDITVALKKMYKFSRYGSVVLNKDKIIKFKEKKYCEEGFINGGIYIIKRDILKNERDIFSFEEYLSNVQKTIYGYKCDEYFIDIGIPKDYYKAQKDLAKWL